MTDARDQIAAIVGGQHYADFEEDACGCSQCEAEREALRKLADQILSLAQPRYFSGCLRDGVCRGVCRNTDCPNYDLVVAARVCVEPKEDGILYPTAEGMK